MTDPSVIGARGIHKEGRFREDQNPGQQITQEAYWTIRHVLKKQMQLQ